MNAEYNDMREKYMSGNISFREFYLWNAQKCHIAYNGDVYMGRTIEQWAELYQSDEHFNNVPLAEFDMLHPWYKIAANRAGVHNSMSDCVCTHKAIIADRVERYLKGVNDGRDQVQY